MAADYVPAQYSVAQGPDLRRSGIGPKGYKLCNKRKLDEIESQVEAESSGMAVDGAAAIVADPVEVSRKRFKANTAGVGKVSGRPWKPVSERASALKHKANAVTYEQRMAQKAKLKEFQERKREAAAVYKEKMQAKRKQREAAKERKKANQMKSAVVQKISNPQTLKRLMKSKKARKRLVTVDPDAA